MTPDELRALADMLSIPCPPNEILMNLDDAMALGLDVSNPCHCEPCEGREHFHWRSR